LVDKSLISKKLERIETYLTQIRQKKDPGIDLFSKDRDLQSIVLFNLIQLIQTCIDINIWKKHIADIEQFCNAIVLRCKL
jgi:uncharacterized protein YutE (UPF0331/DUF86 family)